MCGNHVNIMAWVTTDNGWKHWHNYVTMTILLIWLASCEVYNNELNLVFRSVILI